MESEEIKMTDGFDLNGFLKDVRFHETDSWLETYFQSHNEEAEIDKLMKDEGIEPIPMNFDPDVIVGNKPKTIDPIEENKFKQKVRYKQRRIQEEKRWLEKKRQDDELTKMREQQRVERIAREREERRIDDLPSVIDLLPKYPAEPTKEDVVGVYFIDVKTDEGIISREPIVVLFTEISFDFYEFSIYFNRKLYAFADLCLTRSDIKETEFKSVKPAWKRYSISYQFMHYWVLDELERDILSFVKDNDIIQEIGHFISNMKRDIIDERFPDIEFGKIGFYLYTNRGPVCSEQCPNYPYDYSEFQYSQKCWSCQHKTWFCRFNILSKSRGVRIFDFIMRNDWI